MLMLRRVRACWALMPLLVAAGCLGPEDVPSHVHDLRVIGVRLDPPELMAPACIRDVNDPRAAQILALYASEIQYTALVLDPEGEGREISWRLWACADSDDRMCEEREDRFPLGSGATTAGELQTKIVPALQGVDLSSEDLSGALLFKVLEEDPYRGLGGIRVPLNLHLRAGDEEIWAQKLMVYSCNFFPRAEGEPGPTMAPNVNPELPGVRVDGQPWGPDEVPVLTGPGPFVVEPEDFADRQEHYVVPSFELQPVELDERWKIAWHADYGRFSPNQSGGADLGGGTGRHRSEWTPPSDAEERDVRFWFVVRDGRGGTSWMTRTAHYHP